MNHGNKDWFGQVFEEICEPVEKDGKFYCPYVKSVEVKLREIKSSK